MGFLGLSGDRWKKIGKFALTKVAPVAANFIPGVGPLAALGIRAGIGAAGGAASGGGWKSALLGGGLSAIPTGGAGGTASSALKTGFGAAAKSVGKQVGQQAAGDLAAKYLPGPAGQLTSTAIGGFGGGGLGQSFKNAGKSVASNPNTYASFLGQGGGGGGSMYAPNQGYGGIGSFMPSGAGGAGGAFGSGGIMSNSAAPKKGQKAPAAGTPAPGGVNPNGPAATTGDPSGFWGKWGPLITQGGAAAAAWYGGKKAQEAAQKRSPEEAQALGGAQGVGAETSEAARAALGEGRPYLQQAGNYYQTLLRGSRGAMQQAVAGPTAQLTDVYRGAERGLERSGVRGAARDVATSDLNRERASKIAGLTTGVQPYAADALAKMGSDAMSQAGQLYGTSGNVYSDLLRQGASNREYARREGTEAGKGLGSLVRDIGQTVYDSTRKKTPGPTGGTSGPQLPGTPMPIPTPPTAPTGPAQPTLPGTPSPIPTAPPTPAPTVRPGGFMAPKKNVYAGVLGGQPPATRSPYSFTF